ncbi:hypothetical protein [Salinibacter sp. 10B]|uniref:hypothetical protein n=1 Tax=Salinibacter sp. 10B TaxID=1923971 RepID=UPI0011B09F21|nr:hypothetical protein [Salinibacter sp. 10B]
MSRILPFVVALLIPLSALGQHVDFAAGGSAFVQGNPTGVSAAPAWTVSIVGSGPAAPYLFLSGSHHAVDGSRARLNRSTMGVGLRASSRPVYARVGGGVTLLSLASGFGRQPIGSEWGMSGHVAAGITIDVRGETFFLEGRGRLLYTGTSYAQAGAAIGYRLPVAERR